MRYRWQIAARIAETGIVAIVRSASARDAEEISRTLAGAGIDALEVSLTTPGALGAIERLANDLPEALIGAGTVLDGPTARAAILAGARFLVAPSLQAEVIEMGHRYGVAVAPGCQTPTEIERALSAGADLVKLFPADQLGPDYLRAVLAALPQAPVIPTGGIDASNAAEWLDAGAVGLGVGGALTRDAAAAPARAAELLDAVARARR
jgi:2-dehydro-3-deoxyphosphogluconate aldolase / (4S)-4-hydroxy-2-oxoglutarate aldolase